MWQHVVVYVKVIPRSRRGSTIRVERECASEETRGITELRPRYRVRIQTTNDEATFYIINAELKRNFNVCIEDFYFRQRKYQNYVCRNQA